MTQYILYDPKGELDSLFSLPHSCEKQADKVSGQSDVILVEDENLSTLVAANKGGIKAIFVTKSKSAADFAQLKKEADFVLEMPPEKEEVDALVDCLSGKVATSELDMSAILPPEMLQKYEASIFEKMTEVEGLIAQMDQNPTRELLEGLRNSVHKFAGNAASYGYLAATPLCRAHEAFLESCYESIPKEEVIKRNHIFFRKFRLTMQKLNLASAALK